MRQIVKIGSELILHLLFANSWRIMFTRFCLLYHYRVPNHESISSYDTNSKCIFHSLFTLLGTNQIIHVAYYLKKKKQFSIFKWSYCNNFQQQLVISTFSRNNFHASFTCFASWCKTHHQVQPACEPAVRMLTASDVRPKCTQMMLPSAAGALTSYTQYDRKHKWWMQWSVCIKSPRKEQCWTSNWVYQNLHSRKTVMMPNSDPCPPATAATFGTRRHYVKKASQQRQCDAEAMFC